MPATETLIALSALGPVLLKSSVPATAALSSGAAVPISGAPAAGFAAASVAGGSAAACHGIKSLGTALLLTKKGGAALAAKAAGTGFLSVSKGAVPAAGGGSAAAGGTAAGGGGGTTAAAGGGAAAGAGSAAVSLPPSAAPAAVSPLSNGSFATYHAAPHVAGSTPVHHVSPFHSHPRIPGLSPGNNSPPANTLPPDLSVGNSPAPDVRHTPATVSGGSPGAAGPSGSAGPHAPVPHSGAATSNTHQRLQPTKAPPGTADRAYGGVSKAAGSSRGMHSHARRVGPASSPSDSAGNAAAPEGAPGTAAAAAAEQAGGEQPSEGSSFFGIGSHETTVISTLLGVALLRWAVSSLCFGRTAQQEEEGPASVSEATAAQIASSEKKGAWKKTTQGAVCPRANFLDGRLRGKRARRRVERWRRREGLLLDEDKEGELVPAALRPTKLFSEKIAKEVQSADEEVPRKPPILEVCLSESEADEVIFAQGDAVETPEEDRTPWPFPDFEQVPEPALTDREERKVREKERREGEKPVDWFAGPLKARNIGELHSRLEGVSDTTVASSRSVNEFRGSSAELTKTKEVLAFQNAAVHARRPGGRMASFL